MFRLEIEVESRPVGVDENGFSLGPDEDMFAVGASMNAMVPMVEFGDFILEPSALPRMLAEYAMLTAVSQFVREVFVRWKPSSELMELISSERDPVNAVRKHVLEGLQDAAAEYVTEVYENVDMGGPDPATDDVDWNKVFGEIVRRSESDDGSESDDE